MGKVYIYDKAQAEWYIQQGLRPIKVGVNKKTGGIYYLFDKKLSNPLYTIWLRQQAEFKNYKVPQAN